MAELLLPSNTTRSYNTVRELRDLVRSEIAMLDASFISDDDVDGWLQAYQNLLARETCWYKFNTFISTSGGVRYYDLPADFIQIDHVQYDVWVLPHRELHDLIQEFPLALTNAYTGPLPWYYSLDSANRLMLFPMPSVASGSALLVIYAALPPRPVGPDDFYYWPPTADIAAVMYGCKRASLKDLSREGAKRLAAFTAEFEREHVKVKATIEGVAVQKVRVYGRGTRRPQVDPMALWIPRSLPMPS